MYRVKQGLKRLFRRPVLAFANGLERVLIAIQSWLDGLTFEQKRRFSNCITYPALALFALFMLLPYMVTLWNFVITLLGFGG